MTKDEALKHLDEIGEGPELSRGTMKWRIPCFNKFINARKALKRNNCEAACVWILWAEEQAKGGDILFPLLWQEHVRPKLEKMLILKNLVVREGITMQRPPGEPG